jgi:hypothetical protein
MIKKIDEVLKNQAENLVSNKRHFLLDVEAAINDHVENNLPDAKGMYILDWKFSSFGSNDRAIKKTNDYQQLLGFCWEELRNTIIGFLEASGYETQDNFLTLKKPSYSDNIGSIEIRFDVPEDRLEEVNKARDAFVRDYLASEEKKKNLEKPRIVTKQQK